MSPIWAFDDIKNKHSLYRGEDCMKKNFEKKKMLLLTEKS